MKNLQILLFLGISFMADTACAQLILTKAPSGVTKPFLHIPPTPVRLASLKIEVAGIEMDAGKPMMVRLDPYAALEEASRRCGIEQDSRSTLQLDGDRTDETAVALEWKTTNGRNNLGFDVERSLDDTLHFERVAYVWAKSIAGVKDHYNLPDKNTHNKVSFYRIRVLQRNGEYLYSNIAKVGGFTKELLMVYPNPTQGSLRLLMNANSTGAAAVLIYDATGKIVWRQATMLNEGHNTKDVSLVHLPAGSYRVVLTMADQSTKTATFIRR